MQEHRLAQAGRCWTLRDTPEQQSMGTRRKGSAQ